MNNTDTITFEELFEQNPPTLDELVATAVIGDTPQSFCKCVEDLVWQKDIPYLEALSIIMEEKGYEPEVIPKLLTPELYSKLEIQLESVFMVKQQQSRLPI